MVSGTNIFLIGPMGAGKSTVGKQLADRLGRDFFDTDQEIENRTGVDISWIYSVEGEDGFRVREQKIISELTKLNNIVLSTGGGSVICPHNRDKLAANGTVIYLAASNPEQVHRTERNRRNRPQLQVDDLQQQIEIFAEERHPLYASIADLTLTTDGNSVRTVVNRILEELDKLVR